MVSFVTTNKWKFEQATECFKKKGLSLEMINLELPEPRNDSVIEVARAKALFAYDKLKTPLFVLDGGLYISALNGFPATYIKFVEKTLGAEGIFKLLKNENNRNWKYQNCIYFKSTNSEKYFVGTVDGTIANYVAQKSSMSVRDFDRIQTPIGYEKTFSEMSDDERNHYDKHILQPKVFDDFIKWLQAQSL